jgi:hypothetical protein
MRSLIIVVLVLMAGSVHAQPVPTVPALPSPTYIPTSTPMPTFAADVPRSDIYYYLATAAANFNALPDDPAAPGGVPLLPNDDGRNLFGYARWLLSGSVTPELLGPLAPFGTSTFVWVTLIIVIVAIFLTLNLVTTIVRFVVFVISFIRRLLPF